VTQLNLNKYASVWTDLRYVAPEINLEICISYWGRKYQAMAYTTRQTYTASGGTRLEALIAVLQAVLENVGAG